MPEFAVIVTSLNDWLMPALVFGSSSITSTLTCISDSAKPENRKSVPFKVPARACCDRQAKKVVSVKDHHAKVDACKLPLNFFRQRQILWSISSGDKLDFDLKNLALLMTHDILRKVSRPMKKPHLFSKDLEAMMAAIRSSGTFSSAALSSAASAFVAANVLR